MLDSEALFNDPRYLMQAALGDEDDQDASRWRLLLLEDRDELIASDAKRASGQALSRLLNLTDGLLGQGRNVLVAITTNEDIRSLHPAVIRPGRCLAQIRGGAASSGGGSRLAGRRGRACVRAHARRPLCPADHRSADLLCRAANPGRPLSVAPSAALSSRPLTPQAAR